MLQDGKAVGRIQRNWPNDRSVQLTCYRHEGCRLLKPSHRFTDSDDPIIEWLFSVRGAVKGESSEDRKKLRAEHKAKLEEFMLPA